MAEKAVYLNYINIVNTEINNASSMGADTRAAASKLEEAKRALSNKDYNNVSLLASDAYRLALTSNMGFVSIKDLISSKEINVPKSKYNGHTVETGGLIRNIKTSGASYNFVIDDGNGVIAVTYSMRHRLSPPFLPESLSIDMRIKRLAQINIHDRLKSSFDSIIAKY